MLDQLSVFSFINIYKGMVNAMLLGGPTPAVLAQKPSRKDLAMKHQLMLILLHRFMVPLAKDLLAGMNSEHSVARVLVLKTKNICYGMLLGEAGDTFKDKAYWGG